MADENVTKNETTTETTAQETQGAARIRPRAFSAGTASDGASMASRMEQAFFPR